MPTITVSAEIALHTINSPGTWLPNRDDIYVTIDAFNTVKRSRLMDPIFPIILHERFLFEKTFWNVADVHEVLDMLEDFPITMELRQVTDIYLGGTLLSYFDTSAREFLCPYPAKGTRMISDRELVMCRTVDFPGATPRMEFSVYVILLDSPRTPRYGTAPLDETYLNDNCHPREGYHSAGYHSAFTTPEYERPTVNSMIRNRSKTPTMSSFTKRQMYNEYDSQRKLSASQQQRPFAVRKVDDDLLSRSKTPPAYAGSTGWRPRSASPMHHHHFHHQYVPCGVVASSGYNSPLEEQYHLALHHHQQQQLQKPWMSPYERFKKMQRRRAFLQKYRPIISEAYNPSQTPLTCRARPPSHQVGDDRLNTGRWNCPPNTHQSKVERDIAIYKHRRYYP